MVNTVQVQEWIATLAYIRNNIAEEANKTMPDKAENRGMLRTALIGAEINVQQAINSLQHVESWVKSEHHRGSES